MGICAQEFRELVIQPTLAHLGMTGEEAKSAETLLLGTAVQASGLGFHLKVADAQGVGIFQITPKMHVKIWDKYLINHPELASAIRGLASQHEFLSHPHAELATNLSYATAIAWMIYRRHNKPLPAADDLSGVGQYWWRYYHHDRHVTPDDFCRNFQETVITQAVVTSQEIVTPREIVTTPSDKNMAA
jgi:hypothetical protein